MKPVTVVLPTYNEVEAIQILLPPLSRLPVERIIIVDDNSPDGTGEAIINLGLDKVGLITRNARGLGSAIRVGATAAQTAYVLVMDSDGQHGPLDALLMLQALDSQDLIIGSRFIKGAETIGFPLWRKIASTTFNRYANLTTRIRCSDPMTGFFIAKRDLILRTQIEGFKILYDILVHERDLQVLEIPIQFRERLGGRSKASIKEVVRLFRTRT